MKEFQKKSIDRFKEAIVALASPRKIILFGSAARGEMKDDSDVDLLVIVESGHCERDLYRLLNREIKRDGVPLDLLVETEETFKINSEKMGSVEHEAENEGIILYAREVA